MVETGEDCKPSFFKIMLEGYTTNGLMIPSAFVNRFIRNLPKKVTIKGPCGGEWQVKVIKYANELFFQDGWDEFQTNYCLGRNEFLIFHYDGRNCFDVQIFLPNGCERLYASSLQTPFCSTSSPGAASSDPRFCPQYEVGVSSGCEPPHFVSTIYSAMQYIPNCFARKYFPKSRFTIVLKNSEGRAMEVGHIIVNGKHYFSSGWRSFIGASNLNVGDDAMFELLGKREMQVTLKVAID